MAARTWFLLFGILLVAAEFPLLLSPEVPPLDLANHLGRAYILAHLPDNAGLRALYDVHLVPTPNLAADLLLTPLVWLLGADLAVRLFVALGLALRAAGFAALCRSCRGRLDAVALLGVPLAHNLHLNYGFINYYFGVTAALLTYAVWLREPAPSNGPGAPRPAAYVMLPLLALLTYLMHLVGFGVLLIAAGASLLVAWQGRIRRGRPLLAHLGLLLIMVVLPAALYLAFSRGVVGGRSLHRVVLWNGPLEKALGLLRVLRAARPAHDLLLFALLAGLTILGLARRSWRLPEMAGRRMVLWAGLALLLISLALPNALDLESSAVDLRVASPALLLLLAAVAEWPQGRVASTATLVVLLVATGLRSGGVFARWQIAGEGLAQSRQLCDVLPAGARVLTLHNEVPRPGTVEHEAGERHGWAYCLQRRPLFFPALFHVPGSQPLVLRLPTYEGADTLSRYHLKNGFGNPATADQIPWPDLWPLADYVWLSNWDLPQANPQARVPLRCFEEVGRRPLVAVYRLRKGPVAGCP